MGLKFRRGSTAQQSGSLAFGEPYVNTTLGTLVIGGATGDIVLSATGTGSTGNFGAISGSGLDITGNANIAGNLTLGGQLTIGDNTSDTVNVVASLSSSLIPSTTNVFDLGSSTKIWKDLYISTGSIKFVDGISVVKELSLATLTALETATGSANVAINAINLYTASNDTTNTTQNSRLDQLSTASGSAITRLTALEVETSNLESFTGSINTTIKTQLNSNTVVSGSSQITYESISSIPAGIVSGSAQTIANLPTGTVSGSSQVTLSSTTGYNVNEHINHTGVLINAGNGLTGGGSIAATRTINVVGGNGITVNADNIELAGTYTGTWAVTGGITATADVVAYASSDRRLKDNIQNIENPIEKVQQLNGVTWDWNSNADELQQSLPNVGVIAQEVEEVLPQLVHNRENGYKAVDYAKLTGLLIEAIKEQQKQIDDLTIQMEELKKQKGL